MIQQLLEVIKEQDIKISKIKLENKALHQRVASIKGLKGSYKNGSEEWMKLYNSLLEEHEELKSIILEMNKPKNKTIREMLLQAYKG